MPAPTHRPERTPSCSPTHTSTPPGPTTTTGCARRDRNDSRSSYVGPNGCRSGPIARPDSRVGSRGWLAVAAPGSNHPPPLPRRSCNYGATRRFVRLSPPKPYCVLPHVVTDRCHRSLLSSGRQRTDLGRRFVVWHNDLLNRRLRGPLIPRLPCPPEKTVAGSPPGDGVSPESHLQETPHPWLSRSS